MSPKIVALLPMKANSSRVPGKNFRDFCGKPLYRWVLDSLLSVDLIDKIVINTDAREILVSNGLVESSRILIRDRHAAICGDDVSMNIVLANDVANVSADYYFMTHTTNPLLAPSTIVKAIDSFFIGESSRGCDSMFSVNKIQTRFYDSDVRPVNHDPKNLIPTQQLEPLYEENSNFYIFTRKSFLSASARIGSNPMMFETPAFESIDIDTPDDWNFAEIAYKYLSQL